MSADPEKKFEELSASEQDRSIVVEFYEFLRDNKKWWLLPVLIVLLLLGVLILLSGTAAAPFIYTIF